MAPSRQLRPSGSWRSGAGRSSLRGCRCGRAFAANAISFVVSAALIAAVRGRFRSTNPDTETSTPQTGSVWAGARFLWRNRTLLTLTAVGAVTFLATDIVAVADLPLIHHFGVGGVGYGIMNVAWGAGGLIGALIAARIASKENETAAAVLGVLVFGVFVAAVGISPWFAFVPLSSLLFAVSDSFAFVGFSGIYQRGTPDAIRGRMFAAVGATTTFCLSGGLRVRRFPGHGRGLASGLPGRRPHRHRLRRNTGLGALDEGKPPSGEPALRRTLAR